jgi:hypothetical protein
MIQNSLRLVEGTWFASANHAAPRETYLTQPQSTYYDYHPRRNPRIRWRHHLLRLLYHVHS